MQKTFLTSYKPCIKKLWEMWIERLSLKNFRQHRDTTIQFSPYMNMVVGPVGVGKTNLLDAAYYCLTNHNRGSTRQSDICQFATPKDEAYVHMLMHHDGKRIELMRGLRPLVKELIIQGEKPITKDTDIKEEIEALLGASYRVLDDYIFVGQDSIRSFISKTDSSRAKSLQLLFGTEKAEKCWNAIGDFLSEIRVPTISESEDSLRTSIKTLNGQLVSIDKELTELEDIPDDYCIGTDPDHKIVTDWQLKRQLIVRQTRLRSLIESEIRSVDHIKQILGPASETLKELEEEYSSLSSELNKLQNLEQHWQLYASTNKRIADLNEKLSRISQPVLPPIKPEEYEDVNVNGPYYQQYLSTRVLAKSFKTAIDALSAGDTAACPTCLRPIDKSFKKDIETYQKKYSALAKELQKMEQVINVSSHYDSQLAINQNLEHARLRNIEEYKRELSTIPTVALKEPLGDSLESINKRILEYREACRISLNDRDRQLALVQSHHNKLVGLNSHIETYEKELLEIDLSSITVTEEQAMEASERSSARARRFQRKLTLLGTKTIVEKQIKEVEQRLVHAESVRQTAARLDKFRGTLVQTRDVLHRDKLPRIVAQNYLEVLSDDINATLQLLDSNFRVTPVEGLDFKATFHDGRVVTVDRLSGGEKTIFAIAFRLVVNSTFANEVGILCLDEPTAGLPPNDVSSLEAAFDRLKSLSKQRNLQVIMITHERGLGRLFDQVIDLSPVQTP